MDPSDLAAHQPAAEDSSDDAIIGQDLDSRITSWNKGAERMFGYSADEVLGRSISVLIPIERWPEEGILVSRIKRGDRVAPFETVRRARSGQLLDVVIAVSPVRDDAGAIVGVSKLFRDITGNNAALAMAERQRQQLTAQLEEERARLVEAQSVAKVGSWHTDLATMVVTWSAETYRMFETTPAEFDNSYQAFLSHVHPDDRSSVDAALTQSIARKEPTVVEHRILLRDGRVRFVEERWVVSHDSAGRPVRALGTCRDMTEQKQYEARLRESLNELHDVSTRLNDAREEERARMARDIHDHLGQALTALKLDVGEVKRRLKAGDEQAVVDRLDEMADLIDGAVNDVRRVAAELRPVVLDDLGFVLAIKAYLLDVERRSGLQCQLITGLTDLPIATDRATALFRILQEALTNVIRHAGARHVHVTLSADADTARLVIRDDGCGIPAAQQRNPRAIGLLGMRDRARLFGGSVEVTGGPGEGTTVVATLPLMEPPK